MSDSINDPFDDFLKDKLDADRPTFDEAHWLAAEAMLQKERKRFGLWIFVFVFGLGMLAGAWFFGRGNVKKSISDNRHIEAPTDAIIQLEKDKVTLQDSTAAKIKEPISRQEPPKKVQKAKQKQPVSPKGTLSTAPQIISRPTPAKPLKIVNKTQEADSLKTKETAKEIIVQVAKRTVDTLPPTDSAVAKVLSDDSVSLKPSEIFPKLAKPAITSNRICMLLDPVLYLSGPWLGINTGLMYEGRLNSKWDYSMGLGYQLRYVRNIERSYTSQVYGQGLTTYDFIISPKALGYINGMALMHYTFNGFGKWSMGLQLPVLVYSKSSITENVTNENGTTTKAYSQKNLFNTLPRVPLQLIGGYRIPFGKRMQAALQYHQGMLPYSISNGNKYSHEFHLQLIYSLYQK